MAVTWDSGVNQKILRDSSWGEIQGFISDTTLSGKQKRRMAHSMAKRPFQVSMLFTYTEYVAFSDWYQDDLKFGTLSFAFPKIDGEGTGEYRFAEGGEPQYTNESGVMIRCNMVWEEV